VAATESRAGLVVVPIYWEPHGGRHMFPPGFESTIDGFIANVAAAHGSTDNVFSVATEYYGDRFGVKTAVRDDISAAHSIGDGAPFPLSGCKPLHGYVACITDAQLRSELRRLTRTRRLLTDLAHLYVVFLPPEVETTGTDGSNSVEDFCAYHGSFASGDEQILCDNQPFDESNCGFGQSPNGNAPADNDIGVLSHEMIEVMTDPLNQPRAWDDKTGHEIADLCAGTFGRPLGSTRPNNPAVTEYNQVIHGGRYYLPQEFSNIAFERFGSDRGCVLSEKIAESATATAIGRLDPNPQTFLFDATPTSLPADGTSTARIRGERVRFGWERPRGRPPAVGLDVEVHDHEARVARRLRGRQNRRGRRCAPDVLGQRAKWHVCARSAGGLDRSRKRDPGLHRASARHPDPPAVLREAHRAHLPGPRGPGVQSPAPPSPPRIPRRDQPGVRLGRDHRRLQRRARHRASGSAFLTHPAQPADRGRSCSRPGDHGATAVAPTPDASPGPLADSYASALALIVSNSA